MRLSAWGLEFADWGVPCTCGPKDLHALRNRFRESIVRSPKHLSGYRQGSGIFGLRVSGFRVYGSRVSEVDFGWLLGAIGGPG